MKFSNASCTLNLHTVTKWNCHHFYNKTSSTEVLEFNNFGHNLSFYGEMAVITYIKIEQNYSKYIFNESISQSLVSITNNKNNIKYYRIIFTSVSIIFILTTLQPKAESSFCYYFFDTLYHSILYTQCCFAIVSPALTFFFFFLWRGSLEG